MKTQDKVIVKQMELGPMKNFIYFLGDASTKEIAVIDPAWDMDVLRKEAKKNGWKISSIFLTHGHPDHVNGIDALQSTHDIPVYISSEEAAIYTPKCKNLRRVKPDEILQIGTVPVKCLHTPGHSPGCQCFLTGNILIAGDTVFIDGCGRCDLPGGNAKQMYASLYNVIMKLPDDTVIYPGHNYGPVPFASLAEQKRTNPYMNCSSLEEFLTERMGIGF